MAKLKLFPLDVEWYTEKQSLLGTPLSFRCGTWLDDGKLYGTKSLATFKKKIEKLPADTCFIGHNVAGAELKGFLRWGIKFPRNFSVKDSMIAARFLNPAAPSAGLKMIARELGYIYDEAWQSEDEDLVLDYCGKDTFCTQQILQQQIATATKEQQKVLDFYYLVQRAFFCVETAGLKIDVEKLVEREAEYSAIVGGHIAAGVDKELITNDRKFRDLLEEKYGFEYLKKKLGLTKDKEIQVDAKKVKKLPKQTKALTALLDARDKNDYRTLYLKRPLEMVNDNGFIFPQYLLLVPKTHRRSTKPAIQNWPAGAREIIISRFRGGKMLGGDFKNLEARLFAWQAGCKSYLDALVEGGYILLADRHFGWKITDKKDPRYTALKATILAITYNMTVGLLRFNLENEGIVKTFEEVQSMLDGFFDTFPEIYQELEDRKNYVWEHGTVKSSIPGVSIPVPMIPEYVFEEEQDYLRYRKVIENKACNFPTQCLASYVTAAALVDIQEERAASVGSWGEYVERLHQLTQFKGLVQNTAGVGWFPVVECHDELVFDCHKYELKEAEQKIRTAMTKGKTLKTLVPNFNCPLDAELAIADSWIKG